MNLQSSYDQFFNRTPIASGDSSPSDYTYLVEDFIETAMNYTSTTLATYNSSVGTLVSAFSQLQTLASQKNSLGVSPSCMLVQVLYPLSFTEGFLLCRLHQHGV